MSAVSRDPHTGYLTTGHEWNGIEELNTPVPRVVLFFLVVTVLFSVAYWVAMPAWPLGTTFTRGTLGLDQRATVAASLEAAALERAVWTGRVATESDAAIQADPGLMAILRQSGHTLFGDNCAACHGTAARGGPGYPSLRGERWLWGGTPEVLAETIRVGINAGHPESRVSQMLAFGRDGLLSRAEVDEVVAYVRGLSGPQGEVSPAGKAVYDANCAACHGEDGKGMTDFGAPDLTDDIWIYGGDLQSIFTSVWHGRQGHMPAWEERLSAVERRILALYLADLRTRQP